jgi:EAL domain-containing protein (putative c-di-GMP-specific phosphodiesterase class I)
MYLPDPCERFVDPELDDDFLLQQMAMGFCIVSRDGRIHAVNGKVHDLFEDYEGGFLRWWNKAAEGLVGHADAHDATPCVITRSWTDVSGTIRYMTIWMFAAGSSSEMVFLFMAEKEKPPRSSDAGTRVQASLFSDEAARFGSAEALNQCMMQALMKNVFSVRYQPVFDVRSGRVAGVEALIQLTASTDETLSRNMVNLLDASGGSLLMGLWLLGRISGDLQAWKRQGSVARSFFVQVRMSQRQLASPCMFHAFCHTLGKGDGDGGEVWIKASKRSFDDQDVKKQLFIHRYHAMGINFIVDRLRTNLADLKYFFAFSVIPFKAVQLGNQDLVTARGARQQELFTIFAKIFSSLGVHVVALYSGGPCVLDVLKKTTCRYIQKQGRGSQFLKASQVPGFIGMYPSCLSADPCNSLLMP